MTDLNPDGLAAYILAQAEVQAVAARDIIRSNAEAWSRGLTSTLWDEENAEAADTLLRAHAHRRIVAHHSPANPDDPADDRHCAGCGDMLPCPTLRYLGLAYSGRVGYREEWRP